MKAYVTSCGEKTTEVCIERLERFGFQIIHDDRKIPWHEKYKYFIEHFEDWDDDILRVDADVILNKNILKSEPLRSSILMAQFQVFDFYQNDVLTGQPVWYSKKVFPIIKSHLHQLDEKRPETWAWRLADVNPHTISFNGLVGMHGFFQDEQTMKRAEDNKNMRGQEGRYDFELAKKLSKL